MIEIKKIIHNKVYGKHLNEWNKMVAFVAEFSHNTLEVTEVDLIEYEQRTPDFENDVLCDLIRHELNQDERTLEEWNNYLYELI